MPPPTSAAKPTGLKEFDYLVCDGGPHLVLPKELSSQWKGAGSMLAALNPKSDYGRAVAATANQRMALIPVGSGQAMVLDNPPLSSWGHSPEGWIDIYDLEGLRDRNVDAMLKRAVDATPTASMTGAGKTMTLAQPGLILLFAGETPGRTAYGQFDIPLGAGSYQILEGHYKPAATTENVYVYRFRPTATNQPSLSAKSPP